MKIGIIGAGFTGLSAGYYLSKNNHNVTIIEENIEPGGLAAGFKLRGWKWPLEKHYHHLFLTDKSIRKLARRINYKLIVCRPKTSTYFSEGISQLDSPLSLLGFERLSFLSRLRTGFIIFLLKVTPFIMSMENISTEKFIKRTMGWESWNVMWRPLLERKFGTFSRSVSSLWFWARIKTRTSSLIYPNGGFSTFAWAIIKEIKKMKSGVLFNESVESIDRNNKNNKLKIKTKSEKVFYFDKVICTLPIDSFKKIVKKLPKKYCEKAKRFKGLGAISLVLILKKKMLPSNTYWLNINEDKYPFLCVVEHTNFMESRNYGGDTILYIGNYLKPQHPYFSKSAEELFEIFLPYLMKINPEFSYKSVRHVIVFKTNFAQPIVPTNYSKSILPFETPIPGLYLANMQQVYPWDRGTNYAIELGNKVADLIIKSKND